MRQPGTAGSALIVMASSVAVVILVVEREIPNYVWGKAERGHSMTMASSPARPKSTPMGMKVLLWKLIWRSVAAVKLSRTRLRRHT